MRLSTGRLGFPFQPRRTDICTYSLLNPPGSCRSTLLPFQSFLRLELYGLNIRAYSTHAHQPERTQEAVSWLPPNGQAPVRHPEFCPVSRGTTRSDSRTGEKTTSKEIKPVRPARYLHFPRSSFLHCILFFSFPATTPNILAAEAKRVHFYLLVLRISLVSPSSCQVVHSHKSD